MASKFGLAGGIPERRVRPIWDAIDSRQYKNALKHSASLLSKFPNSPYALALKALILERMGKSEEALSICLNAKELLCMSDSFLMDDLSLSTLQIVFQRLDRLDLATGCYEFACGKFPNNLELIMGLFNCYVREYSYVKQQQTAIKMYKLAGEERFLLWAVCSIQSQVFCGHGGEKLLALAEGLLKKHIVSHSLHEPEAVTVYISVLEQQGKYGDALEVLSGKLGSLLSIEVDRLHLQGRLLARAGDNAAAACTFQKILESCPDDWQCFLHYLGCLLEDDKSWCNGSIGEPVHPPKSVENLSHVPDDMFDSRVSDASIFVQKLQTESRTEPVRGPYLAILELERRKYLHGKGEKEKLLNAFEQYFCRFGHLACFCSDVEAFLEVLTPDEKMDLLEMLMKSSASLSMGPTRSLGQSLTLQKMQEIIGNYYKLPASELEGFAVKMIDMYCRILPLSRDLDLQEGMHGEELLCMVSNLLVQLFWRSRRLGYLLEAVMVLEFGLTIRRYVWQYKILLLHLYSHLGALPVAYEWYGTLDVKNILLETVLHHILPQMLSSPLWVDLNNILKDYLKFMDDHFRESADLTFLAFHHRNYSKVIEFVQFKDQLQHSNQYLVARLESYILRLKEKAGSIEEEECVLESMNCGTQVLELVSETSCNSLTFNEDLQTRPWWTPTSLKNYLLETCEELPCCSRESLLKCRREWEVNMQKIIQKRSFLPRMIYLSIRCASNSVKENIESNGSIDSSVCLELKSLLAHYADILGFSLNDAVEVLVEVSDGRKSLEALGSNMVDWLNLAVFYNAWSLNSHEDGHSGGDGSRPAWHIVTAVLEKCVLHKVRVLASLVCFPGGDLPMLVQMIAESLAWHHLVLQSYVQSWLPCGKKKKKAGPADQSSPLLSHMVLESISSLRATLQVVAKWLREQIDRTEGETLDLCLSSVETEYEEGPGQVFRILKDFISSASEAELGDRIFQALKSWSPEEVARKIVNGQHKILSEFLQICNSKMKKLEALRQQI
ncbi:hypothetical protein Nepgr_013059 [Nepenthes gracilis]|uniref:Phagocyte signaling-impaired protein n=1 Tax=Nepenthes gracilis TaxID=150966 RepID=A0AAD3XNM9_NEPGR|nr:hypothetical protein Nepgr_013059 [Nepenthes gracilis]